MWHVDETYIKVRGQWQYLYRAIDSNGDTVEKGRQALLGVAAAHFVQQGDENASARGADGMAEGDGAAVDVHDGRIPAHVLVDRERLGRKGLVRLDEVEI